MNKHEINMKRKQTAAKFLKKILTAKIRSYMRDVKDNAWFYYN